MIEPGNDLPSNEENFARQKHAQFVNGLCEFLIHAHQNLGIPKEVIYIHLQVHCQDIMNGIVKGAFNYSEEKENSNVCG